MKKMNEQDLREFLLKHGIETGREGKIEGGRQIMLDHCPFDPNHKDGDAKLLIYDNGGVGFKCHHASCQERKLKDFIKFYEPDYYKDTSFPGESKAEKEPKEPLKWIKFSEVKASAVDWLVPGYIPRKGITILGADGGTGKGAVVTSLVASISAGRETFLTLGAAEMELPEGFRYAPGRVVWLNAEDPYSQVIKPMLDANRANEDNILALDEKQIIESGVCYSDEVLKEDIKRFQPDLVVFDPLQQFLPDKVKMAERNLMRREVGHAMSLAKDCNCAVLIVMHTNKQKLAYGRKRLADSADMWDISRSVLMLGLNEQLGEGSRYLSQEKSNFSRLQNSINFIFAPDRTIFVTGRDDLRDREHVLAAQGNDIRQENNASEPPAKEKAKDYILQVLQEAENHEMKTNELKAELKEIYRVGENALEAAKAELKSQGKIKYRSTGGGRSKSKKEFWIYLP